MPNRKSVHLLPAVLITCSFILLTACMPKRLVSFERRMPLPERREVRDKAKEVEKRETKEVQYGVASWYGWDFHGKPTSSGEIYDMHQLTCAHNTLPLGTVVMVTHLENGKSLELKVNDRGPFVKERIIDLSYAAARDAWNMGERNGLCQSGGGWGLARADSALHLTGRLFCRGGEGPEAR